MTLQPREMIPLKHSNSQRLSGFPHHICATHDNILILHLTNPCGRCGKRGHIHARCWQSRHNDCIIIPCKPPMTRPARPNLRAASEHDRGTPMWPPTHPQPATVKPQVMLSAGHTVGYVSYEDFCFVAAAPTLLNPDNPQDKYQFPSMIIHEPGPINPRAE
jgi:hypothetical protein